MEKVISPARRLSDENWRLFDSWKRERNNLQEFRDQYVLPHADVCEDNLEVVFQSLSENESVASCGHTACNHLTFCEEGSISKYESCLDTARSSLPVIHQEAEEDDETDIMEYEREDSFHQNWLDTRRRSVEKRKNEFSWPSFRMESDVDSYATIKEKRSEEFYPNDFERNVQVSNEQNSRLTAAVSCLLAIEPFQKYFRGIIYHESTETEDENMLPNTTLEYVLKVFKKTRRLQKDECLKEIHNLAAEFSLGHGIAETCFETLKGMVGRVHEEIIMAKHNGNLKRTCLRKCRQSNRSNHSVISHVFRGHLRRRAQCSCGHQNISHDPFTTVPLFASKLDEKILVIPVNSRNEDNEFTVVRYLLQFNQYTRIDDIKTKLSKIDNYIPSSLFIASVKHNDIKTIHHQATTIFDAMCEDGQLEAFVIWNQKPRKNIDNSLKNEDGYPFTSTPALMDFSDADEEDNAASEREDKRNVKKELAVLPVVFKDDSFDRNEETQCPPAFIQVQKTFQGRRIVKVLNHLLGATEVECKKVFATAVKIKDGSCIVCSEPNCSGCHITPNKFLTLDSTCKIVVFIPPNMNIKKPRRSEHESVATGAASNIYTVSEGVAAFRNGTSEIICSVCEEAKHLECERTVMSYPDILVLINNSDFAANKELAFPYFDFSPSLSKSNKNKKRYDLSGLISYTDDNNSYRETVYLPAAQHMQQKKGNGKIEIFIYTNNLYDERRRIKRAASAIVKKRKGKAVGNCYKTEDGHLMLKQKQQVFCEEEDQCRNDAINEDDTASTCNCSKCQCWVKCAEQIRGNSNTALDKIKQEEEIKMLKESSSPTPNMAIQLQRAIFKQDLRRVVSLLKKGASPNDFVDGSGAIHFAAGLANPAGYLFTKLLIDHGANVSLKSSAGQTPIQFAAMFGRSETVRLLSYHGADLAEAELIGNMRNNNMSNHSIPRGGCAEALCTPQESPVSKRYFEENCNDDDPYLRTMIQLKKSLALDHEILDGPKCRMDDIEGLRDASVKAVADKLYPNKKRHAEASNSDDEKASDTQSLVPLEITGDIAVSDLSDRHREPSPEHLVDEEEPKGGVDEVDNLQRSSRSNHSQIDQSPNESMNHMSSVEDIASNASEDDAIEKDFCSMRYVPKSHIRATENRWSKYLCCTSGKSSLKRDRNAARSLGGRGFFRTMLDRFVQLFHRPSN